MENKIIEVPKWPIADEREEAAINKVLRSGNWWRNAGTEVKAFEKEFAKQQGSKGGVTIANGTQALEIALKALHIGKGDEVIVPDFTFYSTVSAVLAVHAIPVMVDVCEDTFCIAPEEIEKAITEKTKAVIPVHMAGNIADMDAINKIANKHNIYVIEDAAHAHGAFLKEKGAGSLGTISCFSFQNAKLMTAGEGGIILSDNQELLHQVFIESNCGREENDTTYQHVIIGTNSRLSEIQGAILRIQLLRLSEQVALREQRYEYLCKLLQDIKGITLQKLNEDMTKNPHYMVMFYYDKTKFHNAERAEFVQYLKSVGIPCNRAFEAIHKLPVFRTLEQDQSRVAGRLQENGKVPSGTHTERISNEVVCLNHNILLGNEEVIEDVVEAIRRFQKEN